MPRRLLSAAANHLSSSGATLRTSDCATRSILEWLSGDECRGLDDAGLIAGVGLRLLGRGVPLDRLTLHLPTLHPMVFCVHHRLRAERAGRNP